MTKSERNENEFWQKTNQLPAAPNTAEAPLLVRVLVCRLLGKGKRKWTNILVNFGFYHFILFFRLYLLQRTARFESRDRRFGKEYRGKPSGLEKQEGSSPGCGTCRWCVDSSCISGSFDRFKLHVRVNQIQFASRQSSPVAQKDQGAARWGRRRGKGVEQCAKTLAELVGNYGKSFGMESLKELFS
jgi:hypothetical protein